MAKKARTATESESTSGSEDENTVAESISGSEDGNIAADENSTVEFKTGKKKYPVLPSVKPRLSLLHFGHTVRFLHAALFPC